MVNLDLAQLDALSAAVAAGTFDAAARELHVTPSAISQRVKALEIAVGQVLLTRTKPIQPTPAGQAVLRLARQIATMTADVAREIGGEGEPGSPTVIPLAVNADSLATWVLPALATIGSPLVFDLYREDQDRTADLLRDGTVMAAVTASADAVPGCTVQRLGRMRYRPVATAGFAAQWFPAGVTPHALSRAPMVVFDRADRLQDRYLKRRARRDLDPPRHYVPASADFLEAVRLGMGWSMLPDLQVDKHADGAGLVELDRHGALHVELYWQQWRLRSASLDRVADAVRAAAAATLR
jgi:LysR family transcriptional regulator (chromosome initiation inhibitor)